MAVLMLLYGSKTRFLVKKRLNRIQALQMKFFDQSKAAHEEIDCTMKTYVKSWKFVISNIVLQKTKRNRLLTVIGCMMAHCLRKIGNTGLLAKEVQEDLGSMGEVDVFLLWPEQAMRMFPDGIR